MLRNAFLTVRRRIGCCKFILYEREHMSGKMDHSKVQISSQPVAGKL